MAKRGRKPKTENNRKGYFYEREENAIVDFLQSEDETEKNKIFNDILHPAFTKMIESIIRRYNLYVPDEDFKETFDDTISFLMTKIDKFKIDSGYKAYSYCGTICKNYLIYRINQYVKHRNRNDRITEETHEMFSNSLSYSYTDGDGEQLLTEVIKEMVKKVNDILNHKDTYRLKENEIKVGNALVSLLDNWEDLFVTTGSNKFNKSSILLFIKELTQLDTKDIRNAMRKYKAEFKEVKKNVVNDIY